MKKKAISILLTCLLTLSFASCGSEASDPASKEVTTQDQTEVTLSAWWSNAEQDLGEAVLNEFMEKNPDIKVTPTWVTSGDYQSKLNVLVAADQTPDIYFLSESLVYDWGQKGVGADLQPMYESSGLNPDEIYVPAAMYRDGENLWGVNFSSTTIALYYNKSLFEEAGVDFPNASVDDPWTWDEFVEAAKKLTKDANGKTPNDEGFDVNNIVTYGTLMPSNNCVYYMPLLLSNNASFANEDGTEFTLSDEKGIEVMQAISDLSRVHHCAPDAGMAKNSFSDMTTTIMNGQVAMAIDGTWVYGDYANENFDIGIAPIPMFEKPADITWSAGFMLSANSEVPDEAFRVFQYITDFNNTVAAAEKSGVALTGLPQTLSTMSDPELNQKWKDVFSESVASVTGDILNSPNTVVGENVTLKNFSTILDQYINPQLDKLWLGETDAKGALEALNDPLKTELKGSWN